MQQMKNKKERGITLIALVVTIIVLIILAGISINLVFGNFGVITKAKEAKELQKQAQANEQVALNELDKKLEDYDKYLPENTKENPQDIGTIVKTPDKWNLETVKYIKTNETTAIYTNQDCVIYYINRTTYLKLPKMPESKGKKTRAKRHGYVNLGTIQINDLVQVEIQPYYVISMTNFIKLFPI